MIKINLALLLAERNMTQAELARLTGIRHSTICNIYNSTCSFLKLEHVERICRVLKCGISDILQITLDK